MKRYIFENALLPSGWAPNVLIEINDIGLISKIIPNHINEEIKITKGYALPGMNNVHSHAFQRAMAGLTEYSTSSTDSFWTWRDLMYLFAEKITPKDLKAIASQLYLEMLKAGYVSVAEFHYLHRHDGNNSVPMSNSIIDAAKETGIGLCHLPVLYANSGFGALPLSKKQRRFEHDVPSYLNLLSELQLIIDKNSNQHLGIAFHSLRAVPTDLIKTVMSKSKVVGPIHIHIAEQIQEVNDCLAFTNKRPVELLFENAKVDSDWCLVHATHLAENEVQLIAKSGAVVAICPTTEANLGDGIFPIVPFLKSNGAIAIGSDSHISVSVIEELRLLEYGQRLQSQRRNVSVSDTNIHTGSNLYLKSLKGGSKASGFKNGSLEISKRADILVLDSASPLLVGTPDRSVLDRFIFNGNVNPIKHVFVNGEELVHNYKHAKEDQILSDYTTAMERLKKHLD